MLGKNPTEEREKKLSSKSIDSYLKKTRQTKEKKNIRDVFERYHSNKNIDSCLEKTQQKKEKKNT